MQILARQNYIGTNTPHGATIEIHASVIRHPYESTLHFEVQKMIGKPFAVRIMGTKQG
jgi:hypothetical protein